MDSESLFISKENLEDAVEALITSDVVKRQRCIRVIELAGERGLLAVMQLMIQGSPQEQYFATRLIPKLCRGKLEFRRLVIRRLGELLAGGETAEYLYNIMYLLDTLSIHVLSDNNLLRQMLPLLLDENPDVRRFFAEFCGRNQFKEAVPYLRVLLDDEENYVSNAAYFALNRISGAAAMLALEEWNRRERNKP